MRKASKPFSSTQILRHGKLRTNWLLKSTSCPITAEYVAYVLEKERPNGILLAFGGQSAFNVGIELDRMGVFERLSVKVLGTPIRTLEVSEDRDLFV